ncbi:MAG: asparagine synthetase A [Candidatus ainarchaeum sp.]|nr:asparagine synthetase A [Candidatus ainarchaeum sp.]
MAGAVEMRTVSKPERLAYEKVTSGVLQHTTSFFHKRGFNQRLPQILSTITDTLDGDPGSAVLKSESITYLEQRLMLMQSMILHKQILIKNGVEKFFIISPNIRLENPVRRTTGKHLFEFNQVDFEVRGAKMKDIFRVMDAFIISMVNKIIETCPKELELFGRVLKPIKGPFPVYDMDELVKAHGPEWEQKLSEGAKTPFWVTSIPREFYDKADPAHEGKFLNYDLIYNGGFCEALSGGERETDFGIIMSKVRAHNLQEKPYVQAFLKLAEEGLVPSAGGGFGVERLVRYLTGAPHVGDVQMFPRVPGEPVIV